MKTVLPCCGAVVGTLLLLASPAPVRAGQEPPSAPLAPYQRLIETVAERHGLDPRLFAALVETESARQSGAVSSAGAVGLAQLMPETARRFGVRDPANPEDNLDGAARYLRWLLDRFRGRVDLALAAYNAGEGAVDRHGGIPPYRETMTFVTKVMTRAGLRRVPGRTPPGPARLVRRPDGTLVITNRPPRADR
ncbi:MAG TPA: lytic transglycosylase domain-containing protein [Acidobacteria bacterium]|nr:lytic transglycosylase domain-containing protein [Acidobacteriota bacterium]